MQSATTKRWSQTIRSRGNRIFLIFEIVANVKAPSVQPRNPTPKDVNDSIAYFKKRNDAPHAIPIPRYDPIQDC